MQMVPFNFDGAAIRAFPLDGEPWFVGKDVASALGYANTRKAIIDHCRAARPAGGNVSLLPPVDPQTVIIPERDVYRLIMRSKLPSAERFEELVVGEILPAIRKTGSFGAVPDLKDPAVLRALLLENVDDRLRLEVQTKADAPKVAFAEQVELAPGAITLGQAAKVLGTGRNRLCSWLREIRWLTRTNEPYQEKIEAGLLDVRLGRWEHPENGLQQSVTALVTGKGMLKLHGLRAASPDQEAA